MLDIELIKKGCEFAEGYKVNNDEDIFITPCGSSIDIEYMVESMDSGMYKTTYYPLFLQRVKQGINKKNFNSGSFVFKYQILTEIDNYHVYDSYNNKTLERFYFGKYHDFDIKIEQAIKYILELL